MMVLWERIVIDLSHPAALLFAILSLLGITSATIYQKRFCPSFDLRTGTAIQYIAASLVDGAADPVARNRRDRSGRRPSSSRWPGW